MQDFNPLRCSLEHESPQFAVSSGPVLKVGSRYVRSGHIGLPQALLDCAKIRLFMFCYSGLP